MKRRYIRPVIRKVTIDNEISMVMMSPTPPGDPGVSLMPRGLNPLRWLR